MMWIAPIAGLAVAGGIALLLFSGGGSSDDNNPSSQVAKTVEQEEEDTPVPSDDRGSEPLVVSGDDKQERRQLAGARQFAKALKRERLWSSVDFDGDTLIIQSASCEDDAMRQVLAANAGELKAAGLTSVSCQPSYGGPSVFEGEIDSVISAPEDAAGAGGE